MVENAGMAPATLDTAPLWKRAVACFLDFILLAVIGMGIGFLLFDSLARMGLWGAAVGFAVALVYFGVCDSRIRRGQSLGRMAMKLRVVSRSGAPLEIAPAFARAAIFLAPYFLPGIPFDLVAHLGQSVLLSMLIFGTAFGLAYLLLFNRATRQSLHDLAAGAYVVQADARAAADAPVRRPLARGHTIAVALLYAVAGVLPVLGAQLTAQEPFASLIALQNLLATDPGVARVNVTDAEKDASRPVRSLSIQVALRSKALFDEAYADKVARIALDNHAAAKDKDAIAVTLSYGYDIGIASAQTSKVFTHSPDAWRARLGQKPAGPEEQGANADAIPK
ncbi:RDD family protein [Oxalobacteraceae bacterium CAVE-383]|nr:RDD family protein [Oxalobacteraceae bacterium CAVE-383]